VTTYTGAGPTNSTQVAAFDPAAPGTPTATKINSQWQFSGYACASTTQCTAVDNGGNEVTYDPAAPGSLVPVQLAAPPSTVQPPVPAKVLALLSAVGAPSGAAAKIAAILKRGGFTYALRAPGAGTASSSWYAVPVSGRAARASARVLVASGSTRFTKSGRGRLKVKLSRAGRRLLKGARSLRLTSTAAFKPKGHARYVKGSAFTLRR
jgi:hypothetical protein